jgi:hypothetical protein
MVSYGFALVCIVGVLGWSEAYIVGVVLLENPASVLIDFLMAHTLTSHGECRVHVHVMAGKIQTDQALEYNAPARKCRR